MVVNHRGTTKPNKVPVGVIYSSAGAASEAGGRDDIVLTICSPGIERNVIDDVLINKWRFLPILIL